MRRLPLLVLPLLLFALLAARASASDHVTPPNTFAPMGKLLALEGVWIGRVIQSPVPSDATLNATLTYESISAGQAVLERLQMGDNAKEEMVSIYHQAGDQLMMTHYCSSNTQPRMRTQSIPRDLSVFKFEFVDSTNILMANWMNIESMVLEFPKPDVLIQRWKTRTPGEKECVVEARRRKAPR